MATTARARVEHEILVAGLIGGLAKLVLDTTLAPLVLTSPTAFLRRAGEIILEHGQGMEWLGAREVGLGLFVHFVLSIFYAYLVVAIVRRVGRALGIAIGVGAGIALYLIDFYVFTALFPWFVNLRGALQIVSHAVFGAIVALVFFVLHPRPTLYDRRPRPEPSGPMIV